MFILKFDSVVHLFTMYGNLNTRLDPQSNRGSPDVYDGQFDVVVVKPLSRPRFLANFPSLYKGTHLSHPAVRVFRGTQVEARPLNGSQALLDTDGEAMGLLPISVELLPKAITFFGFPADGESDGP